MPNSFNSAINIIKILDLLSGIRKYSKVEISERLEISERSFYRYIKVLRDYGFVINNKDNFYIAEKNNKTIKDISSLLHFSEEESHILNEAINSIEASNKIRENLINKLSALFDSDRIATQFVTKENSSKIKPLLEAIREKKQVNLLGYKSSGSGKISDRIIEPFEFTPNYISLWVYEPSSMMNKLFKISRIQAVKKLDTSWIFADKHKANFLDCFRIGGNFQIPVSFKMTMKAKNLLIEEYPLSEKMISTISDNLYIFDGWVSNFDGIGRFILGLSGEFFDIEPPDILRFINNKTKFWQENCKSQIIKS
ncbi:MAG: hypothetical protein JXR68_12510 [Bacteroidales bacterium]|nr:hypothetical protein [Bacteroidales bacterium]